jgi:hypothetical protein
MKEKELRECADCALCKKPFGHTGLPLFWRVTIERHVVDLQAVGRQSALAQFMGSPLIAMHMGDDRDMTKTMMEPEKFTICENCALDPRYGFMIHQLAEASTQEPKPISAQGL